MKKSLFILSVFLLLVGKANAQTKHTFAIKDSNFVLDGKPIQIHSGEMHYARIPKEYWRHRLQMMKAMGLNAVATYVFWNYHETAPGVWDFKTENRNVAEYIKIAQEEGLYVILRPGPYVCAEWEFGGYPWFLQKVPDMVIRGNNKQYLAATKAYFTALYGQVKNLLVTNGGPIIMVQGENEFGSYVAQRKDISIEEHKKYSAAVFQQLKDVGFNVPFFTSDGSWLFAEGALPGALPTANGEDDVTKLKEVVNKFNGGKGPYMVAEFYPGWLDHWAEPFPKVSAEEVAKQTKKYLDAGVSFNYYMVHGGTNFGFTSGANYDGNHDIQPDLTSYDYDAPISEAGWATEKYNALRDLLKTANTPNVPAKINVIAIPEIKLTKAVALESLKNKIKPVNNEKPMTFEELNQGHGYVWYSKKFKQPISGKLELKGLRDYAIVYVNGQKVAELNSYYKNYECTIDVPFNATLDIIVENMGRINYGAKIINSTKGIISPVIINGQTITGDWNMYPLPMDKMPNLAEAKNNAKAGQPALYQGTFNLAKKGDTFLDMRDWGKGIVFINGINIGRYWSVGPQQTLYVPGCWLKEGSNEIVIFEQKNDKIQTSVKSTETPILEDLQPEKGEVK
ncbi:glycoside hydrolase family 35 protein [Flavobacterium nitrogenifigens]|uniref:Beta-galactosidase n=1 Tax=Flavobacterium nitrogenifigens TaxID=1617283 RepID=A0A521F5N5_9FLAO|nr:beta-galactosidase family protein [Flavobacterium nitrogenifigens]KAF2336667.1 beta-galactosidase [Flavobacterium nitrogenifigens]SMO91512.1 beta-galactosidase [Flavobacterium nitrogenifigens]